MSTFDVGNIYLHGVNRQKLDLRYTLTLEPVQYYHIGTKKINQCGPVAITIVTLRYIVYIDTSLDSNYFWNK